MKKKIVQFVMVSVCVILGVFSYTGLTYASIPDDNFKMCLNKKLGKGEVLSEIKFTELKTIVNLDCSNRGLVSFEGVEFLTNLKSLNLTKNPLLFNGDAN